MAEGIQGERERDGQVSPPAAGNGDARFDPRDVCPPQARDALLKGMLISAVLVVGIATIVIPVALRLPVPANAVVLALLAAWIAWPYAWVIRHIRRRHRIITGQPTLLIPAARRDPQDIVDTHAHLFHHDPGLSFRLLAGDPAIFSLPGCIVATDALYRNTDDRELHTFLLHEVAHHVAGHPRLLAWTAACGAWQATPPFSLLCFHALPCCNGFAAWAGWADVMADRLALVVKNNYQAVMLEIVKQSVLTAPDSARRTHLIRFLCAVEEGVEIGEQLALSVEMRAFLDDHPEVQARIDALRQWKKTDACRQALERFLADRRPTGFERLV